MPQIPPIPTWDSLHPVIIHFPIVLLLLSPLLVLVGAALTPTRGRPYMMVGLVILLLGTSTLFVAASTGHAAAKLAQRGEAVDAVLKTHQILAEKTEVIFSVLSAILVAIVALPRILRREETRVTTTWIPLSFLVLYCAGILFAVDTAHAGARLVHEFGVHAIIPAGNGHSNASPAAGPSAETDGRK